MNYQLSQVIIKGSLGSEFVKWWMILPEPLSLK